MCFDFVNKSEVWMYRQATGLSRLDCVVLCARQINADLFPMTSRNIYNIPLSLSYSSNVFYRPIGKVIKALQRIFSVRSPAYSNELSARTRRWLAHRVKMDMPCAVLLHYGTNGIRYAKTYKELQIPVVVHFNGFDLSRLIRDPAYKRSLALNINNIDAFVVVAKYMYDELIALGVDHAKVKYIPYGIPLFDSKRHELNNESCVFCAVGRLTEKKAPLLLIKAFNQCLKECEKQKKKVELFLIGDGELLDSCKSLVRTYGIEKNITLFGSRSNDEVMELLSKSHVFVQHSITSDSGDKEGWPVAVAEAAAAGLPVISTLHASIPEQVIHRESGILVEEKDWEQMAEAMAELALDSVKREKYSRYAKIHIAQWELASQLAKLEDLLLEAGSNLAKVDR